MIPYNIIWEVEISSDSLENQDSPRTNLVDRPLTETEQMHSTPSSNAEVCAQTSESPPINEEECRKCKRRVENSDAGIYPKKIKNVDTTKEQEENGLNLFSSSDRDASDSISDSSNNSDKSDSMEHLNWSPPW